MNRAIGIMWVALNADHGANDRFCLCRQQAIAAYRETEKSNWNPDNLLTVNKIRTKVFPEDLIKQQLPHIHVLDLAADGEIKPHVDSVKFCGDVIGGLSLLSSSVMRLKHEKRPELLVDVLLERRSLYVMQDVARYDFSHAVLGRNQSKFGDQDIPRDRRISLIFRCAPNAEKLSSLTWRSGVPGEWITLLFWMRIKFRSCDTLSLPYSSRCIILTCHLMFWKYHARMSFSRVASTVYNRAINFTLWNRSNIWCSVTSKGSTLFSIDMH